MRVEVGSATGVIPVLLYHSVNDHPRRVDRRFAVSPADFAAHAAAVKASGRVALRVTELAEGLRGERALPGRAVAITFDDGYADTHAAVETLLGRELSSTVYVTTGEVGARDRLAPSQLADLAQLPSVEVGAHAVRHRRLDELDDRELADEVGTSKAELEDLTQGPVGSFSYPHGAYDRRARDAVIAAGYGSAVAVKNAVSHPGDDPFAIARWTVTWSTPASRIAEVLEGEHVPQAWRHERLRTRAHRVARRHRRRFAGMLGVDR
jgi:peptidoglycan/xylan/chitin deacetylase (PgdA/CDA1 family)